MIGLGPKEIEIVDATIRVCGRYGMGKVTMADIAEEVGISRPSLYTVFPNKPAIVRAASEHLYSKALANAQQALSSSEPTRTRLLEAFRAWSADFVVLLYGYPHGAELLNANSKFGAEISQRYFAKFLACLAGFLTEAEGRGEMTLARTGMNTAQAAELLLLSLHGLPGGLTSAEAYSRKEEDLVNLFIAATETTKKGRSKTGTNA